jgi:peroxiredoxin (alkyl hydroperoxide reductase subunit C)
VQVIGISVDSQFSHAAWREQKPEHGGIGAVKYPLVADLTKNISRDYDVLMEAAGIALRGSFLIDQKGVVQHQVVNNLPLGRNVDEMLRMVDVLQFHEKHGEVCPAGWTPGKPAMKPSADGMKSYLKENAKVL